MISVITTEGHFNLYSSGELRAEQNGHLSLFGFRAKNKALFQTLYTRIEPDLTKKQSPML